MKFLLESSPHDRNESSQTSVIMLMIIVGLIPAVIMHIYCFGLGLLWHLLLSCPLAALVESKVGTHGRNLNTTRYQRNNTNCSILTQTPPTARNFCASACNLGKCETSINIVRQVADTTSQPTLHDCMVSH